MLDFNNTEIAFLPNRNLNWKMLSFIQCDQISFHCEVCQNRYPYCTQYNISLWGGLWNLLYINNLSEVRPLQDCTKTINHLKQFGVKSVLDYSAEERANSGRNRSNIWKETLRSIDFAKSNGNIAYAVFKPSTIQRTTFGKKASEKNEELSYWRDQQFRELKSVLWLCASGAYDNGVRILVMLRITVFRMLWKFDGWGDEKVHKRELLSFATLQMYRHDGCLTLGGSMMIV